VRRPAQQRGLTLLEVILAIGLIAVLMAFLLTFFWRALEVRQAAERESTRMQLARTTLDYIGDALRNTVGIEEVNFPLAQQFIGDRRSISFMTTALPSDDQYRFYDEYEELPPARHDIRVVSFFLDWSDQLTTEEGEPLVRGIREIQQITLGQTLVDEEDRLEVQNRELARELGYLEFRYFDGAAWSTEWTVTEGNALPQMVQIVVGFDELTEAEIEDEDLDMYPIEDYPLGPDEANPLRYSTIVRLPAADRFFGSGLQNVQNRVLEDAGATMGVEDFE
jgi:prepilin-type N-terminal cleavage/methylation domain-containing protein